MAIEIPAPANMPAALDRRFALGEQVMALYPNGEAYAATIANVEADGAYVVDWVDGDQRHRRRDGSEVFARPSATEAANASCVSRYDATC